MTSSVFTAEVLRRGGEKLEEYFIVPLMMVDVFLGVDAGARILARCASEGEKTLPQGGGFA